VNWKILLLLVPAGAIAYWWSRQPRTVCDGRASEAPPGTAVSHEIRCRKICPDGQAYDRTAFWGFGGCVRPVYVARPHPLEGVTYVV